MVYFNKLLVYIISSLLSPVSLVGSMGVDEEIINSEL